MWDRTPSMLGLNGLGDTTTPDPNSTAGIVASIAPLVQAGLQAWDMQSIFDFNKQLITQGKAPLTQDQINSLLTGVQPTVNVGLSQQTTQVLEYVALGAGALALLYTVMKHAR